MIKYTAFLRAVNVGGNRIVKMEILENVFKSLGLINIKTLIQSGNVLFETEEKKRAVLRNNIEKKLKDVFGFEIEIMLRNKNDITGIINNNPFSYLVLSKNPVLYIAFLQKTPVKNNQSALKKYNNENEKYFLYKNNLYCLIRKDVKTLFSNNWLEKILQTSATTRNYNTVAKIFTLIQDPSTKIAQ